MEVTADEVLPEVNATAAEFLDQNEPAEEEQMERDNGGERKRESETPPEDDCCPICFSSFTVPCRGNCGHWYCG